jgi:hypothetical protein
VGNTGLEPVTSALSKQRSKPPELITRKDIDFQPAFASGRKDMISFTFAQYPKRDFPMLFCRRLRRVDLTQPEDGRLV